MPEARSRFEDAEQPLGLACRQRRGRLVEDQHRRFRGDRAGNGDQLALGRPKFGEVAVERQVEVERRGDFGRPPADGARRQEDRRGAGTQARRGSGSRRPSGPARRPGWSAGGRSRCRAHVLLAARGSTPPCPRPRHVRHRPATCPTGSSPASICRRRSRPSARRSRRAQRRDRRRPAPASRQSSCRCR